MWFFKLILLIALIASWIPNSHSGDHFRVNHLTSNQEPEPEEEEENEELAAFSSEVSAHNRG